MSAQAETLPKGLVAGVLVLALAVLGLGGAVVALKLRPESLPTDTLSRNIAIWQQQVDADPEDARLQTGLGLALLDADRLEEARSAFEAAVKVDDSAWMAKFQLGLLVKDQDPQKALDLITDAAKLASDEDKPGPLIAKGDLLMDAGDAASAATAYKRSLVYNPFLIEGHVGLAKAYEELGNDRAALKHYQEAQRFDPNDPEVADAIARLSS